jgi:hypothetical protein
MSPESERLFTEMSQVEPYPRGVCPVPEVLPGLGFFPAGSGVWVEDEVEAPMPTGRVMVVGQDAGTLAGYQNSLKRGGESVRVASWRHLLDLFRKVGLQPADCFFTNVYMGLQKDAKSTGAFPGRTDREFAARCQQFLAVQIAVQDPHLILTLGTHVPRLLGGLSPELAVWKDVTGFGYLDSHEVSLVEGVSFPESVSTKRVVAALTDPASRPKSVEHRRYRDAEGGEAEVRLIEDAVKAAGLEGLLQTPE